MIETHLKNKESIVSNIVEGSFIFDEFEGSPRKLVSWDTEIKKIWSTSIGPANKWFKDTKLTI